MFVLTTINFQSVTLGANTLDAFSHGGNYGVVEHATAMDIFTVDTVGSRRQFAPAVPPPYTTTTNENRFRKNSQGDGVANRNGTKRENNWAENSVSSDAIVIGPMFVGLYTGSCKSNIMKYLPSP